MYFNIVFYYSGVFSWYEPLALPGLKFFDEKLSLNDYYGKTYCISTLV